MTEKKVSLVYRFVKYLVKLFYPEIEVVGQENLPDEAALIVGNHCQMNGPIACELYFPGNHYTWCAGEMMHKKEVAAYAYQDFWSHKPKAVRWFYKLLSHLITPLSVCVFNNANTIGVYRDARIISTFKTTVAKLQEDASIIIFPEHNIPHNHIVCQFQDKFIDVAKLYYKRTGKAVCFVPMYLAPGMKKLYLGEPIRFDPDAPIEQERQRLCNYLMDTITHIACQLPAHKVVPYNNIPKKDYPSNIPKEAVYEKAGG